MYLQFPDLQTLTFSISSGLIPASVAAAVCHAAVLDDGSTLIKTNQKVPNRNLKRLREVNVTSTRLAPSRAPLSEYVSWLALAPLTPKPNWEDWSEGVDVLLLFPNWTALAKASREMLRLGNDRQSIRSVKVAGQESHLLLVREPPLFSLLALLEEPEVVAFQASGANVWIQAGFEHVFAERISAAMGTVLLISNAHGWSTIAESPFTDLYECTEFEVASPTRHLNQETEVARLSAQLSLKPDSNPAPASLWVIRDSGLSRLHDFVQSMSNDLVSQLAFAVAKESGGDEIVVIRARGDQSQDLNPPGEAFRTYLRIPNLFLPIGTRLHPPLRRDAAAKTLAPDPSVVVWLRPEADAFQPMQLADDAFRPLEDWVDYVVQLESETLQAWVESNVFAFDGFYCDDDLPQGSVSSSASDDRQPVIQEGLAESDDAEAEPAPKPTPEVAPLKQVKEKAVPVSRLRSELREAEAKFLKHEEPLHSESRRGLWLEMGRLHNLLEDQSQSQLCFSNAAWTTDPQLGAASLEAWNAALNAGSQLPDIMQSSSTPSEAARFMGHIASANEDGRQFIADNLASIADRVTELESQSSVRTVWLAWTSIAQASGGDALMLSRARDRLLARLFEDGMRADVDLPLFLRNADVDQERYSQVRDFLYQLPRRSRDWIDRQSSMNDSPSTQLFVNLSIAYGLARIGERDLTDFLDSEPQQSDVASKWVRDVFQLRVQQVMRGEPSDGPLPESMLGQLERRKFNSPAGSMRQNHRYLIDRLRSESRILEPQAKVDPYRHITQLSNVQWRQLCLEMQEARDPKELREAIKRLLTETRSMRDPQPYCISVGACLECAPRADQETAEQLLKLTPKAVAKCTAQLDAARIIKHGLYLAGHFDLDDHVQRLLGMFRKHLLEPRDMASRKALDEALFECFDGLRRLGLRNDIEKLLDRLMKVAEELGQPKKGEPKVSETTQELQMKLQLHAAAGRFYFGQVRDAESVLDAVRELMLTGGLSGHGRSRGILSTMALRYVKALRHAPIHIVVQRMDDLLLNLRGVFDNYTTTVLYSRSQLTFLEECILVLVSDDVALSTGGRKWLDDDEFVVRKRIHADVRAALGE